MYILPKPQQIDYNDGSFIITYDKKIVIDPSCSSNALNYARLLQDELKSAAGYGNAITRGASNNTAVTLKTVPCLKDEEYNLTVSTGGIIIEASSDSGLLYGVQTLRQIIRQSGSEVPAVTIHDFPEIKIRGFYHDVTRCRIPTLSYLKKLADRLSFYKINQLQLYIEHSFMFEGLSEVWRDDTPLTAEDILELDKYCKNLCIDLVPSLSCFGHLYKVLRTRCFGHLCELTGEIYNEPFGFNDRMMHHTIDVSNADSLNFITDLIDKYMPLFSSQYFNIGADETFDLGKGKSRELAEKEGTQRIYVNHVRKLCEYVVSKGKTPMFWGDIICEFPELITELPKETICLNWGYDADVDELSTKKLSGAGARLYNCPGVCGWNQFVPEYDTAYENIKKMCGYAYKYNVEGVLNTDWGDYGHINHPDLSIPSMIYGAAFSWSKDAYSFDELNRAISTVEFSDASGTLISIAASVSHKWTFTWKDVIDYIEDKSPLPEMKELSETKEMLNCLDTAMQKLNNLIPSLPYDTKCFVHTLFVAIDGMKLIQKTGAILSTAANVAADTFNKDKNTSADANLTASALENWFMYYKEVWESVSRPSELYRVSDIIFKLADMLRDI